MKISKLKTSFYAGLLVFTFSFSQSGFAKNPNEYRWPVIQTHDKKIGKDEIIYQVFTDRFFNANHENDLFQSDPADLYDRTKTKMKYRFGGDIDGLIEKLDYIKKLGATAIWITPVIENDNSVRMEYGSPATAYHGYHGQNWYNVDRHLAGIGEDGLSSLKRLVDEAKKKGIKIILDTVINHSSDYTQSRGSVLGPNHSFKIDVDRDLEKPINERWYRHIGMINDWDNYDGKLLDLINANGYKNAYDFYGYTHRLADLADFNTENPEVFEYMVEAHKLYLEAGVYGFRMDTVKHVHPMTLARFEAALRNECPENSDFVMIGEWFGGGPLNTPSMETFYYKTGETMFNFNLHDIIQKIVAENYEKPKDLLRELEEGYKKMIEKAYDPNQMVNFVDNHDLPRLLNTIKDPVTVAHAMVRHEMAIAMMITMPGIPNIYYGMEHGVYDSQMRQGAFGRGGDPYNRPMMFDDEGDLIVENKDLYKTVKKLIKLRKKYDSLTQGNFEVIDDFDITTHDTDNSRCELDQVFAFKREIEDEIAVFITNTSYGTCNIRLYPKDFGADSELPKKTLSSSSAKVGKNAFPWPGGNVARKHHLTEMELRPFEWAIEIF